MLKNIEHRMVFDKSSGNSAASARTVIRLPCPIIVRISGRESRVVQLVRKEVAEVAG